MALHFYYNTPFNAGTQIDPVDTFTGDGSTKTFTLVNKTATRLATTLQTNTTEYFQYTGGFTKNTVSNTFTTQSTVANGLTIVAPGLSGLTAAAFDQDVVDGVTDPRVVEVPFWMADTETIHLYQYLSLPGTDGIEISVLDYLAGVGADVSWCQLAPSSTNGIALTYGATGENLYTGDLTATTILAASSADTATTLSVESASDFTAGDYIIIDIGQSTAEVRQISSINTLTNVITLATALQYSHYIGETVFTCGRKFWLKVTIPLNFNNNVPINFYDLALRRRGRAVAR